jgi:hypothetical protein
MMKNRHPLASYLVPTTHLGDETLYTQNGSHAQSFREQLSASFPSFQFDVIFFGISEAVILAAARPDVFLAIFLAFRPISPRPQRPVYGINHKDPRHSI